MGSSEDDRVDELLEATALVSDLSAQTRHVGFVPLQRRPEGLGEDALRVCNARRGDVSLGLGYGCEQDKGVWTDALRVSL